MSAARQTLRLERSRDRRGQISDFLGASGARHLWREPACSTGAAAGDWSIGRGTARCAHKVSCGACSISVRGSAPRKRPSLVLLSLKSLVQMAYFERLAQRFDERRESAQGRLRHARAGAQFYVVVRADDARSARSDASSSMTWTTAVSITPCHLASFEARPPLYIGLIALPAQP